MIKLLVCCHKESEKGDDLLVTVKAGAALKRNDAQFDFNDDDGENISLLNPAYNEMTVLYWAWKNYDKLGDPDYLGLMHYRRYFYFDARREDVRLRTKVPKELFREKSLLSEEHLELLLNHGVFLCPRPSKRWSVYKHYALTHHIEDLDAAISILKEIAPDYAQAADEYLAGKESFFFNMFVFPKEIFFRYAEFIFPILERYADERGLSERMFVSERLTGIFIHQLIREKKTPVYLPVLYREGTLKERVSAFFSEWKQGKGLKAKARAAARLFLHRRKESKRI
ncbi:MAG TPA: hypothetical protein DIC18_04450 [Clostridiales bacterium]|nr:hypothetical protein [Clostridiales bacterium]